MRILGPTRFELPIGVHHQDNEEWLIRHTYLYHEERSNGQNPRTVKIKINQSKIKIEIKTENITNPPLKILVKTKNNIKPKPKTKMTPKYK